MAEKTSRQIWRPLAILFAVTLFTAFGTATILVLNQRPLDDRSLSAMAVMAAGAFFGSLATLLCRRLFYRLRGGPRLFSAFFFSVFAIAAAQGLIAAGLFYGWSISEHYSLAAPEGWIQLAVSLASAFFYFYVFGLHLFWPVLLACALLFSLAFLTLRPIGDTNPE